MYISIYISIGSFIIAMIALYISIKKYRNEIIEKQKALIRAKSYESGNIWIIKIWNDGFGTAKKIRFVSKDMERDHNILLRVEQGKIPYPILNKGDSFEMYATLFDNHSLVPIIKFIWDDEYGKNSEREQVLEFPSHIGDNKRCNCHH